MVLSLLWLGILFLPQSISDSSAPCAANDGQDGCGSSEHLQSVRSVALREFEDWLKDNGAIIYGLRSEASAGGSARVVATKDLEAHVVVLRIPVHLLGTPENLEQLLGAVGQMCETPLAEESRDLRLILWLLAHRQHSLSANLMWLPALRVLPAHVDLPALWPENATRLLDGTEVRLGLDLQRKQWNDRFFDGRRNCSAAFANISKSDWTWASSIVASRAFSLNIHGLPTIALVPFADLLNHDAVPDISWEADLEDGAFVMRTAHAVHKGQELHDSYGTDRSSDHWVLKWGFLPRSFDLDAESKAEKARRVQIELPARVWEVHDPLAQLKDELLGIAAPDGNLTVKFTLGRLFSGTKISAANELALALSHLRFGLLDDEFLLRCLRRKFASRSYMDPHSMSKAFLSVTSFSMRNDSVFDGLHLQTISLLNERRAISLLGDAIALRLGAYGRSSEEDAQRLDALESADPRPARNQEVQREVLALRLSMSERRLLQDQHDFVEFALRNLDEELSLEAATARFCDETSPRTESSEGHAWQQFGLYAAGVLWPLRLLPPKLETTDGSSRKCELPSGEVTNLAVSKHCSRDAYAEAVARIDKLQEGLRGTASPLATTFPHSVNGQVLSKKVEL